jgi:hypothetical protein
MGVETDRRYSANINFTLCLMGHCTAGSSAACFMLVCPDGNWEKAEYLLLKIFKLPSIKI